MQQVTQDIQNLIWTWGLCSSEGRASRLENALVYLGWTDKSLILCMMLVYSWEMVSWVLYRPVLSKVAPSVCNTLKRKLSAISNPKRKVTSFCTLCSVKNHFQFNIKQTIYFSFTLPFSDSKCMLPLFTITMVCLRGDSGAVSWCIFLSPPET